MFSRGICTTKGPQQEGKNKVSEELCVVEVYVPSGGSQQGWRNDMPEELCLVKVYAPPGGTQHRETGIKYQKNYILEYINFIFQKAKIYKVKLSKVIRGGDKKRGGKGNPYKRNGTISELPHSFCCFLYQPLISFIPLDYVTTCYFV